MLQIPSTTGRTHLGMGPDANLHPELTRAFEALARVAATLLLSFHLDLASAAVGIARRVRAAAQLPAPGAEIASVTAGLEGLALRTQEVPVTDLPALEAALAEASAGLTAFQASVLQPAGA